MTKKESKLKFNPTVKYLSEVEVNTISQFLLKFNYLERYGRDLKEKIPDDCEKINNFFTAVRKLSTNNFRVGKFVELWIEFDMSEITDYSLEQAHIEEIDF